MERSGMRWTPAMAEAVVKLRAIYLSGDFDAYWEFHIHQDQKRLYPAGWTVVPKQPHPNELRRVDEDTALLLLPRVRLCRPQA